MYNVQFPLSNFQSKQPHYWTFLYAGTLFRQCLAIFDAGTAFQRTGFSPRLKMSSSVANNPSTRNQASLGRNLQHTVDTGPSFTDNPVGQYNFRQFVFHTQV